MSQALLSRCRLSYSHAMAVLAAGRARAQPGLGTRPDPTRAAVA
jgi:hypothetical protein